MFYGQKITCDPSSAQRRIRTRITNLKIIKLLRNARLYPLITLLAIALAAPCLAESQASDNASGDTSEQWESGYGLYRDVSREQSDLAHRALRHAYSANIKRARKSLAALRDLETDKHLPPLSYLLSIAIDVMRYQNGDFEDDEEEKALLKSIEDAAEQGRYLCKAGLDKDPNHPTYLLIMGGIRGFLATLKIHSNPSQAMGDGFQALKLLERSRAQDARTRDSYMGTGIFNCTAANAPLFVRGTLKIIGRSVSMNAGLQGLRISAYQGQYTSVASQLFLIQFLSPYDEELKREKREIFRTLETSFPHNAYYTFLKGDEALCFYPDSFYSAANRQVLSARIVSFGTQDFASRRYANLVRYQYSLLDPHPEKRLAPDTSFEFRDYEFYPVFIEAMRYKHQTEDTLGVGENPSAESVAGLKAWRDSCMDIIGDSPMNPTRKRYYQWHVTDALRWTAKIARKPRPEGQTTTTR
jgi:hypothetical protein